MRLPSVPGSRGERSPTGRPAAPTPLTDHRERVVRLVAAEGCGIRSGNQLTRFSHDRLEHLGRGPALCNERRHPPQRRLLGCQLREGFARLGVGDGGRDKLGELLESLLGVGRLGVHHWTRRRFGGAHAIGGERHDRDTLRRWFERLARVLPNLNLKINNIWVEGWPWHTMVLVQWDGTARLLNGDGYFQHAIHVITLRWGKIHALDVFEDSQEVARALAAQAATGLEEAVAEPIVS